jgi:hypothetical protein
MVLRVRLLLVFAFLALTVSSSLGGFYVLGATQNDAIAAIVAAEQEIVVSYDTAAEADAVGANVTALLLRLEEAGELLSQANLSYRLGDFDSAFTLASLSQSLLDGFVVEAEALTERTIQENYWDFTVTVGGSVIATLAVVGGSFVVWHLLKKKYSGGAGA